MARLGVDPIHGMSLIALRRVPCGTCIDAKGKPTGRTKYRLEPGQHSHDCAITKGKLINGELKCTCEGISDRVCLSCFGTLWERIAVAEMLKSLAELAQYAHAKRKAVEISNPDGTLRPSWEVVIVPSPKQLT